MLHANDYTAPVDIHGEAFHLVEQTIAAYFPGTAFQPLCDDGSDRCTVLPADLQELYPFCTGSLRTGADEGNARTE